MEAIGFVVAIVALGALAMRFGQDSRDGFRSKELDLAAYGVTWGDLTQDRSAAAAPFAIPAVGDTPPGERPVSREPYPTLAFVERALGHGVRVLTDAPDAPALEVRARELAREYWSDAVWTTEVVPAAAFRRVLAELAPEVLRAWVDAEPRPDDRGPTGRGRAEPAVIGNPADRARRAAA